MMNESIFEQDVIDKLKELEYHYYDSKSIKEQRQDICEMILHNILKEYFFKINEKSNDIIFRKLKSKISDLQKTSNLYDRNKQAYGYLVNGVEIENEEGEINNFKLIDFDNPNNNNFLVTNQFRTINDSNENRRPDIVVYINGLPIIVWELKTPKKEIDIFGRENDLLEQAHNQIENYKDQISNLFTFNFFNVISNFHQTKYGSTFASLDRYLYWKSENENRNDYEWFINKLFSKSTLLNLMKYFTIYSNQTKIIAGYHQYYGVRNAIHSIDNAIKNKTKKAGIVFHATGTGKSFSMVFLTRNFNIKYPKSTVLIICDRVDLDDQIFQTFQKSQDYLSQERIVQIDSIDDLISKLKNHKQDGIFFSTVQKFQERVQVLSERDNILIIVDEAHRSHNNIIAKQQIDEKEGNIQETKPYALVLREAFPNAVFLGYTGSPRDDKDASTEHIFGNIVSIYPMSRAESDGFIVPLCYERRHEKLKITSDSGLAKCIEENYEQIAFEAEQCGLPIKKLNKELQKIERIVSNPRRIEEIAKDFIEIYESRKQILHGKAMFVCYNRKIGFEFYKKVIDLKPEYKKIMKLIATQNSSDPMEMTKVIGSNTDKKNWANEFKDENSNFKIAIVIDMWLTGFDVPSLDTLFIDKPIKMHNLIQTIARINRVYTSKVDKTKIKEEGLIIDYIGIANNLKEALNKYDGGYKLLDNKIAKENNIDRDIDQIKYKALMEVDKLFYTYFNNIEIDLNQTSAINLKLSTKMTGIILELTDSKKINEFLSKVKIIKTKFNSISHILSKKEQIKFHYLIFVHNQIINHQTSRLKEKLDDKIKALIKLLEDSIYHDKKDFISKFKNGEKIKLSDLVKYMKENNSNDLDIEMHNYSILYKMLLFSIEDYKSINKSSSETLIDKMNKILDKYNSGFITFKEFVEQLSLVCEEFEKMKDEDNQDGLNKLNDKEMIFFKIINENSNDDHIQAKRLKNEAIKIAKEVFEIFEEEINNQGPYWYQNGKFIKSLRVVLKDLMEKHNFPPEDYEYGATFFVNEMIKRYKEGV